MKTEVRATPHAMARLDIPTAMSFDDFRRAFEAAAPVFDAEGVNQLIARGGGWKDIQAAAERNAPNGLMVLRQHRDRAGDGCRRSYNQVC